jgi:hypothetical protein
MQFVGGHGQDRAHHVSVIGVGAYAAASVCVTPRAGHPLRPYTVDDSSTGYVVIRFTSMILIASYTTSAIMSSHTTRTRWPVVEGEHGLTHARESTSTVYINSNNPTTSHDYIVFVLSLHCACHIVMGLSLYDGY